MSLEDFGPVAPQDPFHPYKQFGGPPRVGGGWQTLALAENLPVVFVNSYLHRILMPGHAEPG